MSSPDKRTIETPEQTSLEFPLAGIGSRFLAMVADTAIQFVIGFILVMTLIFVMPAIATMAKLGAMWVIALAVVAFFLSRRDILRSSRPSGTARRPESGTRTCE